VTIEEMPGAKDSPSGLELLRRRLDAFFHALRLNKFARRCALPADVLVLMPGPLELCRAPLRDVALQAEKFANAVSKVREDYESHYRDNRKRVIADAWEIAYIIESDEERIAYAFACACLRSNRSKLARSLLEQLAHIENSSSKFVVSARRRVARHAWKTGDIETAVKMLRGIRGRAAKNQYRNWLGVATVRNGLLLAESGARESAGDVLLGGMLATGMDRGFASGIKAIYLKAACGGSLNEFHAVLPATAISKVPVTAGLTPVILAGFGWSGSGAVADFLKGHPKVDDVFAGRELGWWNAKYGLDRLYAHFATRGYNRRLLLEFLTRHCFGHNFLADSRGTKSHGGIWSLLDETQRWRFLAALADWLQALQDWHKDASLPVLSAFQDLSMQLLRLLASEDASCVLLSNCIPSDAIAGVRMFKQPAVIVSWRDPGDAFASKAAAFPDIALELPRWQKQLVSRINNYLKDKREVASYARFWADLSFEEFVQSEALRNRLLRSLNLHNETMGATFDPSVSARNIGILRGFPAQEKSAWSRLASDVKKAKMEAEALSVDLANENEPGLPPLAS
jgi:hypothetical protein